MGSTDKNFPPTGYEPKDYFFTETYVEFNQVSVTEERFPEQRFSEVVDYDAAIGEMLCNAYRVACFFGQSSSSMSQDRAVRPVVETGHEVLKQNSENAQISTLLDRQRGQIHAVCQAEIRKHEFQADYDRRSIHILRETIESQQEDFIVLKQKNVVDKINNFFMNSY